MTNTALAARIREAHAAKDAATLETLIATAERRGIKRTLTMNRTEISLRYGTIAPTTQYTIDLHPHDIAAALEQQKETATA